MSDEISGVPGKTPLVLGALRNKGGGGVNSPPPSQIRSAAKQGGLTERGGATGTPLIEASVIWDPMEGSSGRIRLGAAGDWASALSRLESRVP